MVARPVVYRKVAEAIRLDTTPFSDGWELPSIRSLARQHDVSLNTVRRALAVLAGQGQIARITSNRRYVRRRPGSGPGYCKPYPAVGLLSFFGVRLCGDDYPSLLLGSFLGTLRVQDIPVIILPLPDRIHLSPIPGGVSAGPPECRFSAVAFRSGAPEALLAELAGSGAVVMTLDYLSEVEGVDSVAVDCDAEADAVVAYLIELGHRRIGFLAPREAFRPGHWHDGIDPDCRRFSRAMLWAKQRRGLDGSDAYHLECDMDPVRSDTAVRSAVDRLWRRGPAPTALVCFDPRLAEQAMTMLRGRGLRCPSQVSIVVRDMVGSGKPKFTTLSSDPRRIGASAAEHLVNRLTNAAISPARLLFASRLVVGSTTGPPPAATGPLARS